MTDLPKDLTLLPRLTLLDLEENLFNPEDRAVFTCNSVHVIYEYLQADNVSARKRVVRENQGLIHKSRASLPPSDLSSSDLHKRLTITASEINLDIRPDAPARVRCNHWSR